MKTRGGRFLLILGAGLAAMAFVVVYIVMSRGFMKPADDVASLPATTTMTTVAVVNRDVPAFTMLDSTNVALMEVESSTVAVGATDDPKSVYGKMTMMPLGKNQQIQATVLTDTGFSNVLAKGEKGFTMAVPERSTFGNGITANDRVDVLWTASLVAYKQVPKAEGQSDFQEYTYTSTKTLLQDVKVLRVVNLRPTPAEGENQKQKADASPAAMYAPDAPYSAALILGVTDQQAEVLKFAMENGTLDLTLRSSAVVKGPDGQPAKNDKGEELRGDHDVEKTGGITIDELIEKYGLLAPKPAR